MKLAIAAFCVLSLAYCVSSLGFLSNALGSHMVLQRAPEKAHLWGWSSKADSAVTVRFNNKVYSSTAAADGRWEVYLDPTPAGGPYQITVSSNAGESAVLQDILFGDVWVCGGQSNMQFTVDSAFNSTAEVAAAAKYPNIRVFTVGQGTTSATPLPEFKTINQYWSVASPATIGVGNWSEFSAACWFFGRDLYNQYQVPLGLFSDNWGGTPVQAWSSPDALAKCKGLDDEPENVEGPGDPSELWNAMIVPVLPMTIKGAIWYQGEANAGQPNYYACAFPAMIADWRLKWNVETDRLFSFHFVQLAPWLASSNTAEAEIRLAQMYATKLPNVGVATAMDWGDPTSPFNNIHPRYKQIVGERLSLVARGITYHDNVQYLGPEAVRWRVLSNGPNAQAEVEFDEQSIGTGLTTQSKSCDAGVPPSQCAGFELQGDNNAWVPASATISGKTLVVSASSFQAKVVTGVRYAWANYPVATIYNKE